MRYLSSTLAGLLLACADEVDVRVFDGTAGQIQLINEAGVSRWSPNHPSLWGREYWEFENGASGRLGQGQNAWKNAPAGAGAVRTPLTGEPGWFNNAGTIETGTTTTGSYALTSASAPAIMFDPASGTWLYDVTFSIPTLSDGTDTYVFSAGFNDNSNGELTVDGAYLRYKHSLNGGRFEFVTASNSVRTLVDTGIAAVAGNYYHLRVRVTNDTLAECWLKTTFSGGAWTDDGVWGTPTASSSTNIPTGSARVTAAGIAILKSAGTTSRKVKIGYQSLRRISAGTNPTGMAAGLDGVGATSTLIPQAIEPPIVFQAYGRGGWNPTLSAEFGSSVGVSGVVDGTALDNASLGTTRLRTGVNTAGYAAYSTSKTLQIDAHVQPMVIETVFSIPVLSTGAQTAKFSAGLFDDITAAAGAGVWIEIDSNANAAAQCVAKNGGGTTTVSSGLTIVANTYYIARIVITSTSVEFYLKANGAAAFGAPVATITTNIPTATDLQVALINRKSAGTTNNDAYFTYVLAYQRSTTSGVVDENKIKIAPDDNVTVSPTLPSFAANVPSPRTQPWAILTTGHTYIWGSSDFGAGAGGDASEFDNDHPNPFTIYTGTTTTGHVALGAGGGVNMIVLSATSGQRIFDVNFKIPILSDATDTFFVRLGFTSHLFNAVTNGVYFDIDANTNPVAQLITVANSVATTTSTGVTIVAGTWYRLRIEIDNNSAVRVWLVPEGTPWPVTPTATANTNIPSGTAQAVAPVATVKKSAGTNNRKLALYYVLAGCDRHGI